MKKFLSLFLILAVVFGLAACSKTDDNELFVTGRSLLQVGEEAELNAQLDVPVENAVFTWESSDTSVVSVEPKVVTETEEDDDGKEVEKEVAVSEVGLIAAKKAGTATITVKTGKVTTKHTVVVQADPVDLPTAVDLKLPTEYGLIDLSELLVGEQVQFEAKVLPASTDQAIVWSSSDDAIASVDQNGVVTGHVNGSVTITASAVLPGLELVEDEDADEDAEEVYEEVVRSASAKFNVVIPVQIEGADVEGNVADEVKLTAKVNDHTRLTNNFTWKSSNPAVATVDENGKVVAKAIGRTVITVEVAGKDGKTTATADYPFTVIPSFAANELAGGADGIEVSFRYADPDVKAEILAALERFLINEGASIPLMNNSGAVLFSERVTIPTPGEQYVPLMGFGYMYGPLKDADTLPLRLWTSDDPKTLNHLQYLDSIESDLMSLTELALFSIVFNEDFDGYEMAPSATKEEAIPVELVDGEWVEIEDFDVTVDTATAWKINLREDLHWVNSKGEKKEQITVDDFLYSYRMALDPVQQNNRANLFYTSSGIPIKNAEAYFKQWEKDDDGEWIDKANVPSAGVADGNYDNVTWDEVGIHKIDDFSFVFELESPHQQWDIHYNTGSFVFGPVYKDLFEAGFNANRTSTSYGSNLNEYMSSGPYFFKEWHVGQAMLVEKNPHYEYNEAFHHEHTPKQVRWQIVQDNNAAFELFENDELDYISVPSTHIDQYESHEGLRFAPGATSFRFSTNRLTQAESDHLFGVGAWEVKPIMQEDDFMWALYFGLNRQHITDEIAKTNTAEQFYFTDAYVVDPLSGEAYRNTDAGKKVGTGIFDGDVNLAESSVGFNAALARDYYVKALDNMLEKGVITEGTARNKTIITVEIASFDGVTHENILDYMKSSYEEIFNAQEKYPNIEIQFTVSPEPGMNIYYEKQMKGRFDLGLAGISGGLLNPIGFLETFIDDNRSGLLLSRGLDTHNPSILLNLDIDGDGKLDGPKYWSFDALYSATAGEAFVRMGVEARKPGA